MDEPVSISVALDPPPFGLRIEQLVWLGGGGSKVTGTLEKRLAAGPRAVMRSVMLNKSFFFVILVIVIMGCGRRDYGVFMPLGAVVETESVSLEVPLERLLVSIDNPRRGDVVMYEDHGPGLPRGMVLLVQNRVGELKSAAISELKLFGGPEEDWLDEAQLLDDSGTPPLEGIHYRLRFPPIERPMGSNGRIVERQAIYMMGDLHEDRGSICRIQVAWNPDAEEGPGVEDLIERELQQARDALRRLEASVRRCHSARAA